MSEAAILDASKIRKTFGGFVALNDVNLTVRRGERVGLIGPNGSGKSTLTNCLCGAIKPDGGTVAFAGQSIDGMPAHDRAKLGMGRSFQLPRPFHSMSLLDNLRVPLKYVVNRRNSTRLSEEEIRARAADLLGKVGLGGKAARLPRELTQVEMRKLELARAMATEPTLLVSDEAMGRRRHHLHRAHHACRHGVFGTAGRACGGPEDRGRLAE
jgi:branched-chain amino acid transport system ATP-binding protein